MPDNKLLPGTGTGTADIRVATRTVTYSGDVSDVQVVGLGAFAGSDDAKTIVDVAAGEGAATGGLRVDLATDGTVVGIVTESAPANDTASSGLNGRLQRIAQRITSLIALLPTALSSNGGLLVRDSLLQVNISQTPTVSTSPAYTIGDALGGLLTFANAARVSGGSGTIQSITVMSKTPALIPVLELALFNQTFTAVADNAAFNPSDGDMANCIGVIPIAGWADYSLNSIATRFGLGFPFLLTGTSLFGQLVTRTAFTAGGTTDFIVGLQVVQD